MSKIVMANIKMPILVKDGSLVPMSEYIKIQIEPCAVLPEKNKDTDGSIMDKINRILSEQNNDPEEETTVSNPDTELKIIVTRDELLEFKPKKHRKNLSLKNTSKTMSRYTMKAYEKPSSLNTSSAAPSLQSAALELGSEDDQ